MGGVKRNPSFLIKLQASQNSSTVKTAFICSHLVLFRLLMGYAMLHPSYHYFNFDGLRYANPSYTLFDSS